MEQTKEIKILLEPATTEIVEKKSRFIAHMKHCETAQEAENFIDEMKKKYWDARHNCSAFIIGNNAELTRCSDDGEPSGTAGRPMLEVLLGSGIRNVCVVVTRYFGGVLLGTGGLVRAYSQCVKEAIEQASLGVLIQGEKLLIEIDYNGVGKILYLLGKYGLEPLQSEYGEQVSITVQVPNTEAEKLKKEVTETTNGRAEITLLEKLDYIDKQKVGV